MKRAAQNLTKYQVASALALASFLPICGLAAIADAPTPTPLGQLIDVGGYRVHLYCTGTGSPTVVVVGGAFSFDWGLVQPEVAKFTRICTYDPSGTAWSDPYPPSQEQEKSAPLCVDRIAEIHQLLKNASIDGPYVLVGFSIGGLWGRLYADKFPEDVVGMVIVDHAFTDVGSDVPAPASVPPRSTSVDSADSPPVLISSSPITLGLEDDRNFSRLSQRDRELHAWAMSIHPLRPTEVTATECSSAVAGSDGGQQHPFGNRPLLVIRTNNDLPAYGRLQAKLLLLSRNSRQIVAENSSHMVIIDEPEIVISSIRKVVEAIKSGHTLK